MVNANEKDEEPNSESSPGMDEAVLSSLNTSEGEEDEDENEEEEEELEEEEEDDEEEDPEEEKVSDGGDAVAVVNNEGLEKNKEPKSDKNLGENSRGKEKRHKTKALAVNGDKPESSNRKKGPKRVACMGMVFMCSSKTKTDCFRYKVLGLPESKKDQVLKIYRGMRLFLFDVDLRLMYGIFKAVGPGGYNIEPNAFKSEFPSQVRFTVLDDCLPVAEESFKTVLKENYYSRTKFEGLLKSEQVKKLCKLFVRSGTRSKSAAKRRRTRSIERRRNESRRNRLDDRPRALERRKRRARDEERRSRSPLARERTRDEVRRSRSSLARERARVEERRPRSPLPREIRRYTDYDRPPVLYEREPPVPRYHLPPQPTAMGSPVRLYAYERQPLDIPSYVRDHLPEPQPYHFVDRDPYLAYGREPPLYRDTVYTVPPEYHLVSREYPHPSVVQTSSEYRRVRDYRDMEIASDYRSSGVPLPEYRSRTHYKY